MTRPSLLVVTPLAPWPVRDGHTLRVANLLEALAPAWGVTLIAPAGPVPPGIAEAVGVSLPQSSTMPWRYDASPLDAALDRALAGRRFDRALLFAGAEALGFGRRDLPPTVADLIDCNALELWGAARTTPGWRLPSTGCASCSPRSGARGAAFAPSPPRFAWARGTRRGSGEWAEPVSMWCRTGWRCRTRRRPRRPVRSRASPGRWTTIPTLDYHPNVDAALFAARAVFPRVRAGLPEARLLIAGRRPVRKVRELAALPGVEVAADVADMRAVLARTRIGLAPMRVGSGIKNKVLEAWACARPVVMTRVAANGLSLPEGHAGLVRDGPEAQAEAAVGLVREPGRTAALGALARAHVAAAFSWARQAERLDRILRDAQLPLRPSGRRGGEPLSGARAARRICECRSLREEVTPWLAAAPPRR